MGKVPNMGIFIFSLVIRPYLVRPEAIVFRRRFLAHRRQHGLFAIEGRAYPGAPRCMSLEDGSDFMPSSQDAADVRGSLGGEIADLDAADAEHRNCVLVGGVLRLGSKLYRLAGLADREFEATGGAALVGVRCAYDCEAESGAGQCSKFSKE